MNEQRAVETQAALEDVMRAWPNQNACSGSHVKPEHVVKQTPAKILLIRKHSQLQDRAKEKRGNKSHRFVVDLDTDFSRKPGEQQLPATPARC
jgi:hypothetical protein